MNDVNVTINQHNSPVNNTPIGRTGKLRCWREISLFIFMIIGVITSFTVKYNPSSWETLFWIIAFLWSGFLGVYAFQIHRTGTDYEKESTPVRFHQFIFNFGLALLGWIIIYLITFQKIIDAVKDIDHITLDKILLAGLIIISLCGYLPRLVTLFKN